MVFLKKFTIIFVMPIIFKLSINQHPGTFNKLPDNRSIPLLNSSSFVLLPEETSYLCITGSKYPLTFFCILSVLLVISLRSLKNHRFHQQLSMSAVSVTSSLTVTLQIQTLWCSISITMIKLKFILYIIHKRN